MLGLPLFTGRATSLGNGVAVFSQLLGAGGCSAPGPLGPTDDPGTSPPPSRGSRLSRPAGALAAGAALLACACLAS